jgi:hypothetical protein
VGRRDDLSVGEIPSQRWELALELLRQGRSTCVLPGEVPVVMGRWTGWPDADEMIHVLVYTTLDPEKVTPKIARHDAAAGLAVVRAAEAADPRLTQLFIEYGVVYEYLHDYGMGGLKIGDIDADGTVRLREAGAS